MTRPAPLRVNGKFASADGSIHPAEKDPITERVEAAVRRRGMSKTRAAALADIPIWRWEKRSKDGKWKTKDLAAIARVARVSLEWLVGGEAA